MKRKLQVLLGTGVLLLGIVGTTLVPATSTVAALNPSDAVKDGVTDSGGGAGSGPGLRAQLKTVVNILLFVLGSIATVCPWLNRGNYDCSWGYSLCAISWRQLCNYSGEKHDFVCDYRCCGGATSLRNCKLDYRSVRLALTNTRKFVITIEISIRRKDFKTNESNNTTSAPGTSACTSSCTWCKRGSSCATC